MNNVPTYRFLRSLIPALMAAGIFLLVIAIGIGFPFLFLCLLPIFSSGLGKSPRHALEASAIAAVIVTTLTASPSLGIMFILSLGIPAWVFSRLALVHFSIGEYRLWYPVGAIIAHLSMYCCVLIGITTLYYTTQEGGVSAVLSEQIREAFKDMPAEYDTMVNVLAEQWSFLILSMLAWMWAIALYGHAWLANRQLVQQGKALRENLAVTPFLMPHWVLYFLMVAALASIIGSESMRFAGKACFVTLLLPYFFLGIAILHRLCAHWPNRKIFLFFIYLLILSQVWMMLIVAAIGFFNHLQQLNKRLSSGGISPK